MNIESYPFSQTPEGKVIIRTALEWFKQCLYETAEQGDQVLACINYMLETEFKEQEKYGSTLHTEIQQ